MQINDYEQKLLEGWEDVYRKGQLSLWILLALKDGPKYMSEIKSFIEDTTAHTISADDKSMYRALRRYDSAALIEFTLEPNASGPDRKIYSLTDTGGNVLAAFVERNITNVLYQSTVRNLIENKEF